MGSVDNKTPENHLELADQLLLAVEDLTSKDESLASFCTKKTICRFLVSRNWKLDAATKKLRATLEWRQKTKPELIRYCPAHWELMFQSGYNRVSALS